MPINKKRKRRKRRRAAIRQRQRVIASRAQQVISKLQGGGVRTYYIESSKVGSAYITIGAHQALLDATVKWKPKHLTVNVTLAKKDI